MSDWVCQSVCVFVCFAPPSSLLSSVAAALSGQPLCVALGFVARCWSGWRMYCSAGQPASGRAGEARVLLHRRRAVERARDPERRRQGE